MLKYLGFTIFSILYFVLIILLDSSFLDRGVIEIIGVAIFSISMGFLTFGVLRQGF